MQWLLEVALIGLLAATLFHALRLERALGVLKRDRSALEDLVAGFNASTRQAEQGIERLQAAADGAGRQIAKQIDAAGPLKDDLMFLIERGDRLADRLEGLVRAGKDIAPVPSRPELVRSEPSRADAARAEMARLGQESGGTPRFDLKQFTEGGAIAQLGDAEAGAFPRPAGRPANAASPQTAQPRLRSQAERDLLKALRMAR